MTCHLKLTLDPPASKESVWDVHCTHISTNISCGNSAIYPSAIHGHTSNWQLQFDVECFFEKAIQFENFESFSISIESKTIMLSPCRFISRIYRFSTISTSKSFLKVLNQTAAADWGGSNTVSSTAARSQTLISC